MISWIVLSKKKITTQDTELSKEGYWFINSFSPIGFNKYVYKDETGYFVNTRRGVPIFNASFSHKKNLVIIDNVNKKDDLLIRILAKYLQKKTKIRFCLIGNIYMKDYFNNAILRGIPNSNFKRIKEIKWN